MSTSPKRQPPKPEGHSSTGVWTGVTTYVGENLVRLALNGIIGIFVARYLGPANFGLLSYALSIHLILAPVASLGIRSILVRDWSAGANWRRTLASAIALQAPAALLAAGIGGVLIVATRDFSPESFAIAIALTPLPLLRLGDTLRALFEAQGRSRRIALVTVSAAFVSSFLKILAIAAGARVWVFALLTVVEAGLVAVGLLDHRLRFKSLQVLKSYFSREISIRLLKEGGPLLLGGVAVLLYMRLDVAMLGLLAGDQETGIYAVAARLSEMWYFVPVAAAGALYPRLARLFVQGDDQSYIQLTQRFMKMAVAGSYVVAIGTVILAEPVVQFLFGDPFAVAAGVLRVHVLAAPFVFVGVASHQWFVDRGLTRAVMARSLAGALVNVVLNVVLIPFYGAFGAAMATFVSYAVSWFALNGLFPNTRELFWMQLKGFTLSRSQPKRLPE